LAEIAPLRGIRFDRAESGLIGPLIAPPYDVASRQATAVEYSISRIENVNLGQSGDQDLIAAERYRHWLARGILHRDPLPALYIHRHKFSVDGASYERTGLFARVKLRDWSDRVVLPHERTNPGPRLERLGRLRAVGANLSPLYFLFRDPAAEVRDLILANRSPLKTVAYDRMGGVHSLEAITDPLFHRTAVELFAPRSLFVADGHHRYEAALAYRDERRQKHPGENGPWEYVLVLLAAVEDPGVQVRPTHRVLTGWEAMAPSELVGLLSRWFDVRETDCETDEAGSVALFHVILPGDHRSLAARPLPGNPHQALMRNGHGPARRELGVAAVEGVIQSVIGAGRRAAATHVQPVVDRQAAVDEVRAGRAHVAFLLPAPNLDGLLAVAEEGDLLPPKSTWFEPKAPAGLVINDLARSAT
jgi:uncharacterized protein (DUF1015 family)